MRVRHSLRRNRQWHRLARVLAATLACGAPCAAHATCPGPVAVQVLGSGGPDAADARASAGYLVWVDGQARLLVDAGGGVFLRFGEARAKFESLDAIAITHLHADHVTDLAALLKSGFFSDRKRPLPVLGPDAGGAFPGMRGFLAALFDRERGAFRYLAGYLDGSGGLVRLEVTEIAAQGRVPQRVFDNKAFAVKAVGVQHGPVPALGYLVEVGAKKIAFSGDQNGRNPAFAAMIKGADILVMDHAIPEDAGDVETSLHARPSEIGKLAADAGVRKLVLSHNMARSLGTLQQGLALIRARYSGPTVVATDLVCVTPGP